MSDAAKQCILGNICLRFKLSRKTVWQYLRKTVLHTSATSNKLRFSFFKKASTPKKSTTHFEDALSAFGLPDSNQA